MGRYVIKDFEALSGIKAHTIRIWEQRYGILKPSRSETNIRQYNDDELRHLLNISLLNRNGFKISRMAKMGRAEIENEVRSITATNFEYSNQIDALTMAMIELREDEFERIISMNIARLGFEDAMEQIVFFFMRKIGIMWQTGSIHPAHEHFISNLIRRKLIVAIDRTESVKANDKNRSLLFLPEGELHELALLYLYYLLRKNHHRVLFLGQNVPFRDVEAVSAQFKPDYVFSIFTSYPSIASVGNYIIKLSKALRNSKIYLSGYLICQNKIKAPANIHFVKEMHDFRMLIDHHFPTPITDSRS